ncbi:gliding motility-associated C-terminal domain-containing protein [Polaribacter sargassicola]|uniref:T9SS type B sorting domain-containing protein n=1 Tax=Polaribacter sargassicola TaxID=2836891 RepID=UPI001F4714A9|nr:gliding motility-associated C-terminal domain-containing protein [Polaribacter sp. DS7-9]MCG1036034.1 gliding motility-associated C-terminal domain-containing protein [Polaribacter sp. DS7-9]
MHFVYFIKNKFKILIFFLLFFQFINAQVTNNGLLTSKVTSCNQGYTVDNLYKIKYKITLTNTSTEASINSTNVIKDINLINDLESIFGNGCISYNDLEIDIITTSAKDLITDTDFPEEFTTTNSLNNNFLNGTSKDIFNTVSKQFSLYPRQSINIDICVAINPFCNGRTNPTQSGSNIDFDITTSTTSDNGDSSANLLLKDFHTTEAILAAGLYVSNSNPEANSDGSYDFSNRVIITNEGTETAQNINYNMGLESFLEQGIVFKTINITQVSGPTAKINTNFNGDTNTTLLDANQSLAARETIILEINASIDKTPTISIGFDQLETSQTQGDLDNFDESTDQYKRKYSYVLWSDNLGNHLDRYYISNSETESVSSSQQCSCQVANMKFEFNTSSTVEKLISDTDFAPNGIIQHQKITFQITLTNTSDEVELKDLQLEDNLNAICNDIAVIDVSTPFIQNSNATSNPVINTSYNGKTDINFFDGNSGLLKKDEFVTVEFSVVFNNECDGFNTANFSAKDPLDNIVNSSNNVQVNTNSDLDNDSDGITDSNDIDDDNDTILDIDEYNGLADPIGDHDGDFIPNYKDIDFGEDSNADGIIDVFDFDLDGVPNHFDLDSDNDGILDIVEAGNKSVDINNDGETDNEVGINGLDNTVETDDTDTASITYTIPNTDENDNFNFLDIDADGDGIVDNIEGQPTFSYIPPNNTVTIDGIDTAYNNEIKGILPVDTDNDGIYDFIDTNSDNDTRDDFIEGWDINNDGIEEIIALNIDVDNDGLDDAYDNDKSSANPTNNQTPLDFPNIDTPDGDKDDLDRDWREIPPVYVTIDNVSVTEGDLLTFNISLVRNNQLTTSATPVEISLFTSDGTSTTNTSNTAMASFDYLEKTSSIAILPSTSSATFSIESIDDNFYELNEFFSLNLNITSTNTRNKIVNGIGTLIDNDKLPNLFSPNGDGLSDVFKIDEISNYPNFKIIIIDRWGSEVYNYNNNGNFNPIWWDGTYNNKPVIEGVYYYTIDFNDGFTPPKKGFIQLIR